MEKQQRRDVQKHCIACNVDITGDHWKRHCNIVHEGKEVEFSYAGDLTGHKTTYKKLFEVSTGTDEFVCCGCNERVSKKNWTRHVARKHQGIEQKKFACPKHLDPPAKIKCTLSKKTPAQAGVAKLPTIEPFRDDGHSTTQSIESVRDRSALSAGHCSFDLGDGRVCGQKAAGPFCSHCTRIMKMRGYRMKHKAKEKGLNDSTNSASSREPSVESTTPRVQGTSGKEKGEEDEENLDKNVEETNMTKRERKGLNEAREFCGNFEDDLKKQEKMEEEEKTTMDRITKREEKELSGKEADEHARLLKKGLEYQRAYENKKKAESSTPSPAKTSTDANTEASPSPSKSLSKKS